MTNNIYTYIFDNFNIKVTDYQFKRDYIQNPLIKIKNKYELPYKEDLEYLYITCNLTIKEMIKIFSVSCDSISSFITTYNIKKPKSLIVKKCFDTKLKRYGNGNYTNRDKSKMTCIIKYGVDNVSKSDIIKQKKIYTCLENNGVKHPMQSKTIMDKSFKTCLEKYGFKRASMSDNIKNKTFETNIEKYGNKCTLNNEIVRKKADETFKQNNSSSKSYEEMMILDVLKTRFPNVKTQYKESRYPFKCDYYIPELDLFIEYQGSWVHGPNKYNCHCKFDSSNEYHLKVVKKMLSENSRYYDKAVDTWTKRDVLKRKTAKDNGLNYLEFFNMNEFNKWFENFVKDINVSSKK